MIESREEIAATRSASRAFVRRRARAAAVVAAVPVPGLDILVDAGLLVDVISRVNRNFGLTPQQLDELDTPRKLAAYRIIRRVGARFAGRLITVDLVVRALAAIGVNLGVEFAAKYLPIAGSVISSLLSYRIFRHLAYAHIDECVRISEELLAHPREPSS